MSPYGGELQTLSVLHLDNNEAALCMCLVAFSNQGAGQAMLAVGTARNMQFYPRQADGALRILPRPLPPYVLGCTALKLGHASVTA